LLIEAIDRFFRERAIEKLDKREPAGATRFPIDRDDDLRRLSDAGEMRAQIRFRRPIGHVANEQPYSH
jgi:hypothetical protein